MEIVTIETPTLGDRSYLVHDGDVAVVVDPQRDIDRVLALVDERDLTITHVLETHVHNDYVTGGYQLALQTGAQYVLNAADEVTYDHEGVRDGDVIETGRLRIRVVATPGHTFNHLSYAVGTGGGVEAVFTGGSLLYGSTGRPDLLGDEHAEELARAQYRSAHRLADELPGDAGIFPTHGFGSFCSATQTEGDSSTIDAERRANPVLTDDEATFVATTLAGLGAYPAYYTHMAPANRVGPAPIDLSPPRTADAAELRERIEAGEWVVDLRTRTAFAPGHVPGTVNIGLDGGFVTYLGWLVPRDTPITLLGETPEQVAEAQRELVRIGIDRPTAAATGGVGDWAADAALGSFRTADFGDLRTAARDGAAVLDVRLDEERAESHIPGSLHIPLHELLERMDEVPPGVDVWVHCGTGYRASIAVSLLRRAGRDVVLVDDEFERAASAGLRLVSAERRAA